MKDAEAFRQQYEWAKELDRERVQRLLGFEEALKADPLSTWTSEAEVLANHPQYRAQLQSWAARLLSSARGQAAAAAAQAAQPPAQELTPLQLEDGRFVVPVDQLTTFEQQILAKAQQQFKPAMDAAEKLQRAEQLAVAQQQAHTFATGFLQELRTLPQFIEHEPEIKAAFAQTRLETDHPAEVKAAIHAIYNRLVLPKLTQATESKVLDSLQQKAAASTAVNPGSAAPSTAKSYRSFSELPADLWR